MKAVSLEKEIGSTSYPGRGIVLGRTADGAKAVIAYFIMAEARTAETEFLLRQRTASRPRRSTPQSLSIPR